MPTGATPCGDVLRRKTPPGLGGVFVQLYAPGWVGGSLRGRQRRLKNQTTPTITTSQKIGQRNHKP